MHDFIFLDIETTGLDPRKHVVIEIAAHRPSTGQWFERKVQVSSMDLALAEPKALAVNGYNEADWAGAVPYDHALADLREFCRSAHRVVCWNPVFDMGFLAIDHHVLDVASMAWIMLRPASLRLAAVCDLLGISNEGEHRARRDVERMVAVYERLTQMHSVV